MSFSAVPIFVLATETAIPISDRAGLLELGKAGSGKYVLTANIDMAGELWTPIDFSGELDGAGFAIYNLKVRQPGAVTDISIDGNMKKYDTYFAGFFARLIDAKVDNLTLSNADVSYTGQPDANAFVALLAGYNMRSKITNCTVTGRAFVSISGKQGGIGGIAGFGIGEYVGCKTDVTLTFVDTNKTVDCEQFLGAIQSCGLVDIDDCDVVVTGYASVFGYVHNGGMIGMVNVTQASDREKRYYIKNSTVEATINFFEKKGKAGRRAYCKPVVGEILRAWTGLVNNKEVGFKKIESRNFDVPLLPEPDENPVYNVTVIPPTCEKFGYTKYVCETCGYSYLDDYTAPAHLPGEKKIIQEPQIGVIGKYEIYCELCGELLESGELPALEDEPEVAPGNENISEIIVETISLDKAQIELIYKEKAVLKPSLEPQNVTDKTLIWSSTDEGVAKVDKFGIITCVGDGIAQIVCASADGGASAVCEVRGSVLWYQRIGMFFGWR